jgi:hypothetical protein
MLKRWVTRGPVIYPLLKISYILLLKGVCSMSRVSLLKLLVIIICAVSMACGWSTPPPNRPPTLPTAPPPPAVTVGTITGKIIDDSGDPVPSMQVQLTDLPAFTTTSGPDGRYILSEVPPGQHTIMAQSSGLGSGELSLLVRVNETTALDIVVHIFRIVTPPSGIDGNPEIIVTTQPAAPLN